MRPTVVFLHGLARSHRSLGRLRRAVERAGYPTWARGYPSRRLGLPELAAWLTQAIREDLGEREIFGVTHSLGGVVVRHMGQGLRWRGIVMLAGARPAWTGELARKAWQWRGKRGKTRASGRAPTC